MVGGAVDRPYFVGRHDELKKLTSDLKTLAQNHLILAPRRFGKSSLLHHLKHQVDTEKDLLVPYVNCREMTSPEDFYRVTIKALLEAYESKHKLSGTWSSFKEIFKGKILRATRGLEKIGGSIAELGEIYLHFREREVDEAELVASAFGFFRRFVEEKRLKLVLLFDEFQEIASFNGHIFNLLKKEMDLPSNVRYFFSGSSMGLLSDIFLKEKSPLYLMVAKHYMAALKYKEVVGFVKQRFKVVDLHIDDEAAALFYTLTGGIPFYVQKLGLIAFQQALLDDKKNIQSTQTQQAFQTMINELDGEFEVRWLSEFSQQQRKILSVVADLDKARLKDMAKQMRSKPSDISSSVARLKDMMILTKTDANLYTIVDRVFNAWLSHP